MGGELFIVARDRAELYRFLAQTFSDADTVQVIWDRRIGERRRATADVPVERRQAERRGRSGVNEELTTVGYAFISLGGSSSPISR